MITLPSKLKVTVNATASRRPVPVGQWCGRPPELREEHAYLFPEGEAPEHDIEDIDPYAGWKKFDLMFANNTYRTVTDSQVVYISVENYEALECGS